ncbi:MAG: hypothetical protein H0T78_08725, partial [Longispora sp.]|nr:hypothetical protein [Longispora sp. (in: high G+C Gram-positive bacteria)]
TGFYYLIDPNTGYRILDDIGFVLGDELHSTAPIAARAVILKGALEFELYYGDSDAHDPSAMSLSSYTSPRKFRMKNLELN